MANGLNLSKRHGIRDGLLLPVVLVALAAYVAGFVAVVTSLSAFRTVAGDVAGLFARVAVLRASKVVSALHAATR